VPHFYTALTPPHFSTGVYTQGEYSSLNAQKDICEHYISIHREEGWVSAIHLEDAGFTGINMDRPGIKALLGEVRAGNVDMIVVYKLDRISRSLREFYDFWETLQHTTSISRRPLSRLIRPRRTGCSS